MKSHKCMQQTKKVHSHSKNHTVSFLELTLCAHVGPVKVITFLTVISEISILTHRKILP